MRKYYSRYTDAGDHNAPRVVVADDDDDPRGSLFAHLAAVPQPVADAASDLNSYLSSPIVTYANLKFDEDRGYSVRARPEQAGIPADGLEWWRVSVLEFGGVDMATPYRTLYFPQIHECEYTHGLAKMARDYLAIPGATVDLERRFSIVGDLVSIRRHRLKGDTIRACALLRSWGEAGLFNIVTYWEKQRVLK